MAGLNNVVLINNGSVGLNVFGCVSHSLSLKMLASNWFFHFRESLGHCVAQETCGHHIAHRSSIFCELQVCLWRARSFERKPLLDLPLFLYQLLLEFRTVKFYLLRVGSVPFLLGSIPQSATEYTTVASGSVACTGTLGCNS